MAANYILFGVFIFISLNSVLTDDSSLSDLTLPSDLIDVCNDECRKTPITNASSSDIMIPGSCERGCRFYAIADVISKRSHITPEVSVQACSECCNDSYAEGVSRVLCQDGCKYMKVVLDESPRISSEDVSDMEEPPAMFTSVSFSIVFDLGSEQAGDYDIVVDDMTSDSQEMVKLPEVKVKTLPVESEKVVQVEPQSSSSSCWAWLSSVIEMKSVPPCLIAAALLLVIVMLIRFMFTCDLRSRNHFFGFRRFNDDVTDSLASSSYAQPGKSLPVTLVIDNDKGMIVPGSTLHKMPPPKYDEAMIQGCDVMIKK